VHFVRCAARGGLRLACRKQQGSDHDGGTHPLTAR
jgi:hypothetical protein